jgi:hypothetical protein
MSSLQLVIEAIERSPSECGRKFRGKKRPCYSCTTIIPFDPHTEDKGEGE